MQREDLSDLLDICCCIILNACSIMSMLQGRGPTRQHRRLHRHHVRQFAPISSFSSGDSKKQPPCMWEVCDSLSKPTARRSPEDTVQLLFITFCRGQPGAGFATKPKHLPLFGQLNSHIKEHQFVTSENIRTRSQTHNQKTILY